MDTNHAVEIRNNMIALLQAELGEFVPDWPLVNWTPEEFEAAVYRVTTTSQG